MIKQLAPEMYKGKTLQYVQKIMPTSKGPKTWVEGKVAYTNIVAKGLTKLDVSAKLKKILG